jgi:crotonobetainyl-CoA:carnitine CoA-transferase CaiB-like acyl-CoA transferase
MSASFFTRTRDEWVAELGPADTCVAPVLDIPEVVDNEQFVARDAFIDAPGGDYRQVGRVLAGQ